MKVTVNKAWLQERLRVKDRSQADLARYLGVSAAAVTNIFKGARHVKVQEARKIATFLGCPLSEVLLALGVREDDLTGDERLAVMGYIGADDQVILYQESDPGYGLEFIKSPFPGYQGTVVRIKGDSMTPRYRNGEIIGYTEGSGDIYQLLGSECVVKLEDGRLVLKILQKGAEPDRYTLGSINPMTEPIVNVAVEWVAEIDWHKPTSSRR